MLDFLCFVLFCFVFVSFFLFPSLVSVAGSSIAFRVERTDRQTDTRVLFWLFCVVLRSKLTWVKSITHNTTTEWREGAVEESFWSFEAQSKETKEEGEGEQEEKEEQE